MGHEEDRERKFEQALARRLRAQASGRASADGIVGETAEEAVARDAMDACPDTEMLAAFHERLLSIDEMTAVKAHVAACSRCQEILAHLESSDEVELQAEEEQEKVMEMRKSVLSTGALYVDYAARQNPSLTIPGSPSSPSRIQKHAAAVRATRTWRWVAPAGAIAAGLLIWVAVRDNKPKVLESAQNVQVAKQQAEDGRTEIPQTRAPENDLRDTAVQPSRAANGETGPGESSEARSLPAEEELQLTDRFSKDDRNARGPSGGTLAGRIATDQQMRADKYSETKPATSAKSRAKASDSLSSPRSHANAPAAPAAEPGIQDRQVKNLPMMAKNGVILSPKAEGAKQAPLQERDALGKEKVEAITAVGSAAPNPPPVPGSEIVSAQAGAGAAQKKDADLKANADVATTAQAEMTAGYARTSLKGNAAADAKMILTPGGTVLWRLGAAGLVERSTDRGLNWSKQVSGTTRELVGGSAPSEVVCWIVGRGGLILRTADGGGHWAKVAAPGAGDLAGIRAADALHATILDGAGRGLFATSDGGGSWGPVKE